MSKRKKIAIGVVVALVLMVLGLAIIVPLFFNVDRFRPQVAAQIQEATGKPCQIGRLALTILPRVAIRVDDFSLGNPPGFPAGDFVKTKEIYAVVDGMALLHRDVEITKLELDDLSLDLLQDAQGKWNYASPPPKASVAPAPSPAQGGGPSVKLGTISRLTVEHGQFQAANLLPSGERGPSLMDIHGASIDLHDVNLSAVTTASALAPPPAPGEFAALAGTFNTVVYADDATGPAVAQGNIKLDTAQFGPLAVSKLKSKFHLYPQQVFFDDLELKCYQGSAKGNLSLNFGGPHLSYFVDAKIKGVKVEEFMAAFPQTRGMMTGTLDGSVKMSGLVTQAPDPLVGVNGSGRASIRNGRMPSLQLDSNLRELARITGVGPANGDPSSFSSLSADFRVADARLSSNKISLVGNGVDVDGAGSMTMAGDGTLDYTGDASLAAGKNPLGGMLGEMAGARYADGKLTFPFAVGGTIAKPKFSLKGGGAGKVTPTPANVERDINTMRGIAGLFKKKKQ